MLWEMDISIISGQLALLHVKLEPGDGFEVYGGTSEDGLRVERQGDSEWLVTLDEQDVAGRPLVRYNVYARQVSSGREWAILGGKVMVSQRTATVPGDKLAPVEYFVTVPVVENAVDLTGAAIVTGIVGPRGYSAYEVAVLEGFEGTEAEWLESMRKQTATLAVEKVTPLVQRAERAALEAETEKQNAAQQVLTARQFASKAEDNATEAENQAMMAEDSRIQAAREVDKAAAEVKKATQEKQAAAGHAAAAAKSEQNALAAQQGAERAEQDAAQAQAGAEKAKTEAEAAKTEAQTAEQNAKASADAAAADKAAAEQARRDTQAAQSTAEEQARIAMEAAAAAQAPESIAAQSARPATMLLVNDELMSILGDSSLFNLDTDGQKIIVHTDRISDEQLAVVTDMLARFVPGFIEVVQYNHNMEISWRNINKYAECVTYADMVAVNPDFVNDLTSEGEWVYPLPNLKYLNRYNESSQFAREGFWKNNKNIRRFSVQLPAVTQAGSAFAYSSIEVFDGGFPELVCPTYRFWAEQMASQGHLIFNNAVNLRVFRGDLSSARNLNNAFSGCSKLTEFYAELSSLCDSPRMFYGCQLNKESALRVLNSLPDKAYVDSIYKESNVSWQNLTLGIHVDHQTDDEVLEAIANAESKGWTLTVQWNGTATAQASVTYGMRKPTIYARVSETERPDGTTERMMDWGHYVTDPTGYEEFRSVEEAREYYGLPVEESLTIND